MSKDERKNLFSVLKEKYGFSRKKNTPVEKIVLDKNAELYLVEGKPLFFKTGENIFPTIIALRENIISLPKVTVDMGAVPHVAGGADVMAPGIVELDNFKKGDAVVVIDERNKVPLLVGMALYDSEEIKNMKKGKVIRNIHHVGDAIWQAAMR